MQAQTISVAGTAPTFSTPSASDTVPIRACLVVKNASAGSITVTLVTADNLETGDAYPDKAYTVAAGAECWIPTNLSAYRPASGSGLVPVTFSSVTSVTAAAIAQF
jgi:hypothetical protein